MNAPDSILQHQQDSANKPTGNPTVSVRLPPLKLAKLNAIVQQREAEFSRMGACVRVTLTAVIESLIDREYDRITAQPASAPIADSNPAASAAEPAAPKPTKNGKPAADDLHARFLAALEAGKTSAQIAEAADIDRGAISTFKTKVKLWPAACTKLDATLRSMGY